MSAVKAEATVLTSPDPYSVFLQQMTILGPYLEKKRFKNQLIFVNNEYLS